MIARDAGRAATPPPPPPPSGPSFLRRHPLLAGFGVLAALSLFAAYWPASAIVTGVVVAARASGADRAVLTVLRDGASRLLDRIRNGRRADRGPEGGAPDPVITSPDPEAAPPEPAPAAGAPSPSPSPVAAQPPPARENPRPNPRRPRPAPRRDRVPAAKVAPEAGMEVER